MGDWFAKGNTGIAKHTGKGHAPWASTSGPGDLKDQAEVNSATPPRRAVRHEKGRSFRQCILDGSIPFIFNLGAAGGIERCVEYNCNGFFAAAGSSCAAPGKI
jgi:hypothetical protein